MGATRPLTDRSTDLQRHDQGPLARTLPSRCLTYHSCMPKSVDIQAIERAARAKLDTRVEAVKTLAKARQNKLDKQAEAAAAEREDATAWMAAIRQGWAEDELKDLGFDAPKKTPGRARRRRTATNGSAREQARADAPDSQPAG
jgi:hypothetical protein